MRDATPIAVVGMAGLFPGAGDLTRFWQNIIARVNTARAIPPRRWGVDPETMLAPLQTADKTVSKQACLVDDFQLDPREFDLDPDLLSALDPLYHMVLRVGKLALHSCNLANERRQRTGTILAAIALPTQTSSALAGDILGASFETRLFGPRESLQPSRIHRNQCMGARVTGLPAAILASALGLGGGSYTLDAACASSLYAVKLACDELRSRRSDVMLAGGVSRPDCLYTQVGFSQLQALSPSGRCAPFDARADGLVVGEGAGLMVLKRLPDALADGDHILALIRGIGLSNDISGNLLAPDPEGQLRAMRMAYDTAGLTPADVNLIECHGTGTPVGDLAELNSLQTLWREAEALKQPCAIGSVKSMIGHLLTAAGAAGMLKILLAMQHRMLPPSLHFEHPAPGSPLENGPFSVQTETCEWQPCRPQAPLRAAVSAFGFGGINAHLLLEEWRPPKPETRPDQGVARTASTHPQDSPGPHTHTSYAEHGVRPGSGTDPPHGPVAIVGMETHFGRLEGLRTFQEAVFAGRSAITDRPRHRWRGSDAMAAKLLGPGPLPGAYLEGFGLELGLFGIAPNEVADILPQQLLMLKVAAGAMRDAGLELKENRPRMGALIGIEFDHQATDFQLRWQMPNRLDAWQRNRQVPDLPAAERSSWLQALQTACGPPLTAVRTLGALGGIVASRVAREFRFGGPSFVVSAEAGSGLRALEIGVRSLQLDETEAMLVGAVDLAGDVRQMAVSHAARPYGRGNEVLPFEHRSQGALPGEGAVALVLKRLDRARADGDRIYAVIKGLGHAGGDVQKDGGGSQTYGRSLRAAFEEAALPPGTIDYVEAHGSGNPHQDRLEATALGEFFEPCSQSVALGALKAVIGHTGAAAGLAAVAKTALCLYQQIIPPLPGFVSPLADAFGDNTFHIPIHPQHWLRDRDKGPRRACCAALTPDGNSQHVVLEGCPDDSQASRSENRGIDRRRPLGWQPAALFVATGRDIETLQADLNRLEAHLQGQGTRTPLEKMACDWYTRQRPANGVLLRAAMVVKDRDRLMTMIGDTRRAIESKSHRRINGSGGVAYTPRPLGPDAPVVFVYPGSGNHRVGLGRELGLCFPEVLRTMDAATPKLKSQMRPNCYVPWRLSWEADWERAAADLIAADPLNMIFGQVVHGGVVTEVLSRFGVRPNAAIGYSLGESAALFATGAWPQRGAMLERMLCTDLFSRQLAGPCLSARKAWHIPADQPLDWQVVAVNCPAETVRPAMAGLSTARLLIVNTPEQCVVGGNRPHVEALIQRLRCPAVDLQGVVTVHCDAARPVADAYRALHLFETSPPEGVRYYSVAHGGAYTPTREGAADSIVKQALEGFDFPATIRQAYEDGMRIFVEAGPGASCSGMIARILSDRPHMAVSACHRAERDLVSVLNCLAALIAEGVPVNLEYLYGPASRPRNLGPSVPSETQRFLPVPVGVRPPVPPQPPAKAATPVTDVPTRKPDPPPPEGTDIRDTAAPNTPTYLTELIETQTRSMAATAKAHQAFLDFSSDLTQGYGRAFNLQTHLLSLTSGAAHDDAVQNPRIEPTRPNRAAAPPPGPNPPAYSRKMCMQFAVGSVEKVLGPEFAVVDTYPVRVRLPDEPLMLVDRIVSVEGRKGALGSGRVITEHDVMPGAWYLDGGRAPVCISVEAGQADLFLCAYLGIDLKVKGSRAYRLLDATVEFHRGLPLPGETVRYEIEIKKFVRQGETYLFFFNFEGFIGPTPLISMTDGCAGFFTDAEVHASGGIIRTAEEKKPLAGKAPPQWCWPAPAGVERYDSRAVECLRRGDLAACFGAAFQNRQLSPALHLPGGRMHLIDRVLNLDPNGGCCGLGLIRAQADIHPDDWFLTCHFVDDMVMPGTLMYECCSHALRILMLRMGWVTTKMDVAYEPVKGVAARLKCRGPVTPSTRQVDYQVEIREIGYGPQPFVIAEAHMFADGRHIVMFENMSLQISGLTREDIEAVWSQQPILATGPQTPAAGPLFDRRSILSFCTGKPSHAFGEPYAVFDSRRTIARLPGPPYLFMDRVTVVEPDPWDLKPGGWIEAQYDVPPDGWYFRAERGPGMPFCVLLEIALQPCGWLAAYLGSALHSEHDLKFRNLDGSAVLKTEVLPTAGTLRMRARLTNVSKAGEMIIEKFDLRVLQGNTTVYEGDTTFGFFSAEALARQVGLGETGPAIDPAPSDPGRSTAPRILEDVRPHSPDDPFVPEPPGPTGALMPARALRMIDRVEIYQPSGGPAGLGLIRGLKTVDPTEWFFKAHFFQDPVWPGSLGIEAFLQLIKFMARERWQERIDNHRFALLMAKSHRWSYRGQVIPINREVAVTAVVTHIEEDPHPIMIADGFLAVDGLSIYKMQDFGLQLLPQTLDSN